MAEHVWSVLCERVVIDQRTNLASCLTCIEGVSAPQLPSNIPALSIGSMWVSDTEEKKSFTFRLVAVSPDKNEKVLLEGTQDVEPNGRGRVGIVLDGFPIEQTGKYMFRIEAKEGGSWEIKAKLPMEITLRKPQQAGKTETERDKAQPKNLEERKIPTGKGSGKRTKRRK